MRSRQAAKACFDYFERDIGEGVLMIANSSLHVLADGRRSDLNTRHLITNTSERDGCITPQSMLQWGAWRSP